MAVAVGVWIALAGALALLVGLSARRRVRRLRDSGVKVWAMAVHHPATGNSPGSSPDPDGGDQVTLQYTLADGRVLERPVISRRARPLAPGQKILLWYNPDDPADVLVYGRDGRKSDITFIAVGLACILAGSILAILAP